MYGLPGVRPRFPRAIPRLLPCALLAAGVLFLAAPSGAEEGFPRRPVRMIVSYPPGGATDIMGRAVAQKLSEAWGQPVLIDNRPGASGNIGADLAAKATPDGYTIFVSTSSQAIGAVLSRQLPYDLQKDFAGVSLIATVPNVLVVNNSVPAKSVGELIAYGKANPEKLSFGSPGTGSNAHLAVEQFMALTGARFLHVPYKGNTNVITDLVGGQIAFTIDSLPPYLPFIKDGRLRALGVSTTRRSRVAPDLPTLAEAGVAGYESFAWFGLSVPVKTPRDVIVKMSAETARALRSPDVNARLSDLGADATGSTPEQYDTHIRNEMAKYTKVIQDAKVERQ